MDDYHCRSVRGPIDGVVEVPGSKSLTNRALVLAALADGCSVLRNILLAGDTRIMLGALRALGVAITVDERGAAAEVTGCRGLIPESEADLFCGNSGTTIRFLAALCALGRGGRYRLDGVLRMRKRPLGALVDGIRALGSPVEYEGETGFPPIVVHARGLRGGIVSFGTPPSSQIVSGLLMAAPYAASDVMIELGAEAPSRPFLKMTTGLMERFGVAVLEDDGPARGGAAAPADTSESGRQASRFIVEASQHYQATHYRVEPDATNAMYFLSAAAIVGGRVTVPGLGTGSLQGDVGFVDALERMGCGIDRTPDALTVTRSIADGRLRGLDVDLNDMPDTVPTLAVLALFADAPTTIRNVGNLRIKESDRLAALARELSKVGAIVEERSEGMRIVPPKDLSPAILDTYEDHRLAMSFALAGLRCEGLTIRNPGCCAKTLPDYFERLERLVASAG